MSSFDDYRKKLQEKYGTPEKVSEKEEEKTKKAKTGSSFSEYRSKLMEKYSSKATSSDLENWLTDADATLKAMQEYHAQNEGKYTPQYGGDTAQKIRDLMNSAGDVYSYLQNHKSEIGNYDEVSKSFAAYRNVLQQNQLYNYNTSRFYSQFASEDEYNKWYENNKKVEEYKSVLDAEDFEKYSYLGKRVNNPSWKDARTPVNIFGWTPFGEGDTIGNMVTFAEANSLEAFKAAASGLIGGGVSHEDAELVNLINMYMEDDEKKIYNYYVGKGDTEKASEYLAYITDVLRQREGGKIAENADGHWFAEPVLSGAAGLDQFFSGVENLDNFIMGTEADEDVSSLNYAFQEMSGNNEGLWKVANDLAHTTGNMAPSMIVGTLTGGLGGALTLGTSAVGNAYADMRNSGYDEWQSRAYSTLVGASETALSYFLGGISKLGGGGKGIFQTVASKIVPKLDNAIARVAIQVGGNMLDEGLEEALQEVLDPIFKKITTGEDFEGIDLEQVLYSGLLGALSGGILEGGPTIAGTAIQSNQAREIYGGLSFKDGVQAFKQNKKIGDVVDAYKAGKSTQNQNASDLVAEAIELDPENAHAQRMQARLEAGKDISGYQIDRLIGANQQVRINQDKAKIKSAAEAELTNLGETGDVGKIADVITKIRAGEDITKAESKILTESKYGRRVSMTSNPDIIEQGGYDTAWAEKIGTEVINEKAYNKGLYDLAQEKAGVTVGENIPSVTNNTPAKESAVESEFKASEDGKTRIGDMEVSVKEIASVKDGKVVLRLDDDSTVDARDVDFGSSAEVQLYENVAHMGWSPDVANSFVNGYDGSMPVNNYANGFQEAYRYGTLGIPMTEVTNGVFSAGLTEATRKLAYDYGKADAKVNIDSKQEKIASIGVIKTENNASKGKKKGKLHNTLEPKNETQRASLKTLGVLANTLGIDIYTFESEEVDGKRQGANGWYDPSDNSIHIDLFAGADGKGTMLFTAAHELTHHIREKLPAKFKAFADFLFEQYAEKGISVSERIEARIKELEANGRTKGKTEAEIYDLAYEEVVADSCESFLADGDAVAKIAELKAKDKTLWQTIKDFINNLVARIKAAYEGLSPDSVEGRYVAEMLDNAEKLKAMWTEMVVEASDIANAVAEVIDTDAKPISNNEIITDGAVVTDGTGKKYSIRSMKHDISDGQMFRDLMNHCGFTKEQVGELRSQLEDLVEYMNPYRDIVDLNETYGREGRRYSPYKPNSDPLYTISLDFSTQCSKRLLTQHVIEQLQLRENRPMSPEEQMAIRDMLKEYGKVEKGLQVACVMCYVEAARLKAPKQIQKWLDDPATAMRNFFADKNPEFSAYIKEKQADFKESRGYDRNATKKDMSAKDRTALNKIRPKLRAEYKPSVDEMAIIETASNLPNSTYLTAGNLADLSETHPEIYKAYTAFIRTATRSKALETDEPYYYGDSARDNGNGIIVSDSFIEAVNRENGMRFSSWSDWRIQHLLDWITAVIDNSVRGAAMHGYTKYGDEVRVLGKTGMMFNMSGVAGTQTGLNEDGSLNFSETESMDYDEAIELREEFPETAGLQCIGVGRDHIFALLRSDVIDYVIPYHTSGLNATLRRMGDIYGWKDFTQTQHATEDKSIKKENAVDSEHWHQEPVFSEFFVGYDTGLGGIEAMRKSADNYIRICKERGLTPKFNEFAKEPNYWKLLIDRKMVNQKNNTLIKQRAVTPDFDFGVIKGIVDKYVSNYDSGLEQRAFNHIVENWDNIPKRIRDLKKQGGTKAKKTKKAVDTLANEPVAVMPKGVKASDRVKYSDRASYAPTFYSYMGKVVDGIKSEKVGANGVVSYLKGKGVKAEEIKWSGIEAWLEGKKSVTKAELQEFVAGNQLQIVEQMSGTATFIADDGNTYESEAAFKDAAYAIAEKNGIDRSRVKFAIDTNYDMDAYAYVGHPNNSILTAEVSEAEGISPRWSQYKIDGGENYRELIFQLPDSFYHNQMMRVHWGDDAEGVLAHARIQDITTSDGKKMLFIEEIQSDYHNEGHKSGYVDKQSEAEIDKLQAVADKRYFAVEDYSTELTGLAGEWETIEKTEKGAKLLREYRDARDILDKAMDEWAKKIPDAPFRDTYHEYVLKRLLRMAAEEGYDSIGWTPADIQSERWSDEFAEGYRIEYDQDIPKFLRKYGKKWGATVGKTAIATEAVGKRERILKEIELENLKRDIEREKRELARKFDSYERARIQMSIDSMEKTVAALERELSASLSVWSMDIPDSMQESVLYEGQVIYSDRVTDKKTLDFLENQEHITTYKSFVEIDGKLYSPMATKVKGDDGKYRLTNPSELGVWQQAEEKPDSIPKFHKSGYGYYVLKKDDGGSVTAAYNPYEHSSNLVLNDQFESAYQRPNLVTVECIIPKSEMTSGYKAKYAKDSTGYLDWKAGTVAGKMKENKRKVYLSRWLKPVRILPESEVAAMYKDLLGTEISVPFNVVTPQLLTELEKVGVKIDYEGSPGYQYRQGKKVSDDDKKRSDRPVESVSNRSLLANALESAIDTSTEEGRIALNRLKEYKGIISEIEKLEAERHKLVDKAQKLQRTKGKTSDEMKEMKDLWFESRQIANRINTYDGQLLRIEAMQPIQRLLYREKKMAYQRAAQKGKEALAAYRERATKTQRELLTRYQESRKKGVEGRRKTEMRLKVKNIVNELNQYLLKGTKEKHVPIGLQGVVAEALAVVNMDTVGAEERLASIHKQLGEDPLNPELLMRYKRIADQGERMDEKLQALKNAYDEILNSDDPLIANSHDDVISNSIANVIKEVGDTPIRDMSLTQLESVYDLYRMVLKTIRNTNKAFKAAKGEEISTIANGVIAELMDQKRKASYSSKAKQTMSEFDWNNLKPVYAFERIGSANFAKVFDAVREGEDVWAKDMSEAQAFREEQFQKHKYDSWDFNKRFGFTSTSGKAFELSLDQIMSLYAFSKRDQAGDHLKYGGFVFDGLTEVKVKNKAGVTVKYQLKDATAYNLSEETLAEIIGKLTPEQKAFVDVMQDYLSTVMGEKGNEVSLALYDIKLFKEKYYFPLKSAPQYLAKAKEQAMGEVKIKNSGFTKETTPKAKNPIVLSSFMDVWAGHVNDMSMYHSFTLPLEDFYRVYNYHTPADKKFEMVSVGASLENAHGEAAVKYIDQLLKDLNGGARSDPRDSIGKALMANFKKASVMLSWSVVIQQPSAIIRAQAFVDAKHFAGKKVAKGKHKEMWAEVKKYAPVAIIKEMGYFDTGMGKSSVEWLKGEKTLMDKVDDATSKLPALADEVTWVAIWNAVKRETLHTHKNLRPNSEEFLKAVGERFTEVIVKTQVYDSTLSRSANMRSKSTWMNMVTSFLAEPTTSINMLQDSFRKGKRGKYTLRVMGAVYGSVLLNSALVSIIYAMRDDDEDETFLEKYLSRFTTEMIDGINPLTYIPLVKDVWSLLQGYDVERADMSLISEVVSSLQQMVKLVAKDTSDMDEDELTEHKKAITESVLKITDSISSCLGVPVKNVRRDLNGIINAFKTIKKDVTERDTTAGSLGDNILEDVKDSVPVWGWFPDESKGDKLYDAIVKGDTAYVDRLKGGYKTDSAYQSAERKALRENDPRIKEAAEAKVEYDYEEYNRLIEEIISDGAFSEDDIQAAVEAEVNDMTPDEPKDSASEKEKSRYDVEDVYNEIVKGGNRMTEKMKEEIISTHVANGKTREEAKKSFESSFRSHVGKMYKDGKISRSEASNLFTKHGGYDSNEAYWEMKKLDFKIEHGDDAEYSKYDTFYDAVKTGRNLKAVIREYTEHGVEAETLARQITTYYKPLYRDMSNSERAGIKGYLLNAYEQLGYNRYEKTKDIAKWLED